MLENQSRGPTARGRIEEPANVRVEHPVHFLPHDTHPERIQRLMLVPPRTESIREPQKILLINRIEDFHHSLLNDLVIQSSYAQHAKPGDTKNICEHAGIFYVRLFQELLYPIPLAGRVLRELDAAITTCVTCSSRAGLGVVPDSGSEDRRDQIQGASGPALRLNLKKLFLCYCNPAAVRRKLNRTLDELCRV
jgi:hypothetical protein